MKVKTKIVELYNNTDPFKTESGFRFPNINVAYQTYGKLNAEGDNAILICQALTGNAHCAGILEGDEKDPNSSPDLLNIYSNMFEGKPGWWDTLIGPNKLFDTNKYFIVCSNILGSCYGTTGPVSRYNESESYGSNFPLVTVRDVVRVQKKLVDYLGVKKIKTVTGGSLGGFQVFEWAVMYPEIVESIIPIATAAKHSPWAIALNQAARDAIRTDPVWNKGNYTSQPTNGLSLARKIAMISYRSLDSFDVKFNRDRLDGNNLLDAENIFQVESYLNYQGEKLVKRFDANTYITITHTMDSHDISRDRGTIEEVLKSILIPVLSIGISSDVLYPVQEQLDFVDKLPNAVYKEINSIHGHDAFLIEFDQLKRIIKPFVEKYF